MTIAVSFAAVVNAIESISISGVSIRDFNNIPENAEMILPVFFPNPDDPITDIAFSFESFGSGGTAKINTSYTLNYLYLHARVGSGLSLNSVYPGMMANIELILEALYANDTVTGAVDLRVQNIPAIRVIEDPTGKQYHGCAISLRVLEYSQ